MSALHEASDPELFREIEERNLEQQYFLLETIALIGLRSKNFKFTPNMLYSLHATAANFLDDSPGKIRAEPVHITNSSHVPPDANDINKHLSDFFAYLNTNFELKSAPHLAAYALWRITWIHPFNECNGRTARTFAYLVLCLKWKFWLPGEETIHSLISKSLPEYYQYLASADAAVIQNGAMDISDLEGYVTNLAYAQLQLPVSRWERIIRSVLSYFY